MDFKIILITKNFHRSLQEFFLYPIHAHDFGMFDFMGEKHNLARKCLFFF